jgi:hypothetical protein
MLAILSIIEEGGLFDQAAERLRKFMVMSCELVIPEMPPVARMAFNVAKKYWDGKGSARELLEAKVKCHQYLDERRTGPSADDMQSRATRAVLCLLDSDWASDGGIDDVDWLVGRICRIGPHEPQLELLLKSLFPEHVVMS